jgi:hypothetical protein
MQLNKFSKALSLILLCSFIVACSSLETVVVKTEYVEKEIPIQMRPRGLNLYDVKFYTVTNENLEQFLIEYEKLHGEIVFIAFSVTDYENISLNLAELKRYIDQQKSIIVYYEESIKNKEELPETKSEVVQSGIVTSFKNTLGLEKNVDQ